MINEWERLHQRAKRYSEQYPAGTRIILIEMGTDPHPIESGMKGTVVCVDDIGTVHCKFDNGRTLGLIPLEDSFRKLTDEELLKEQNNA